MPQMSNLPWINFYLSIFLLLMLSICYTQFMYNFSTTLKLQSKFKNNKKWMW